MGIHTTLGKGKLYEAHSQKLISKVSYKIHEELTIEGNLEKWWGELTLTDNLRIPDGDRYVIQLEDRRKGRCSLRRRVNKAVILMPSRYFFVIQGTGQLE